MQTLYRYLLIHVKKNRCNVINHLRASLGIRSWEYMGETAMKIFVDARDPEEIADGAALYQAVCGDYTRRRDNDAE
jgi:hypothetical protein